jgi:hypothetical protein
MKRSEQMRHGLSLSESLLKRKMESEEKRNRERKDEEE